MLDNRPIGVFDSGLGGLTAVRQLRQLLPKEHIVYFGDTGRVPYGTRSAATIARYVRQDCEYLLRHDVKMIIAACGTASSVAAEVLRELPVPAVGVVEPAAAVAAAVSENHVVGVLGTSATVQAGAFARAIRAAAPQTEIIAQACPLFVSLVEAGWIAPDDAVTRETAARYLAPLKAAGADTVVLGCTHFPLLRPVLSAQLGDGVRLIDVGQEAARVCAERLARTGGLNEQGDGGCEYYVSDHPQDFAAVARRFLGEEVGETVQVIRLES